MPKKRVVGSPDHDLVLILAGILEIAHTLRDSAADISTPDAKIIGERLVTFSHGALQKLGANEDDLVRAFTAINDMRTPATTTCRLSIRISDYKPDGPPGRYHFNFEFNCEDCGGYLLKMPDHGHEVVTCAACGSVFGTADSVRERCRDTAKKFMSENGL